MSVYVSLNILCSVKEKNDNTVRDLRVVRTQRSSKDYREVQQAVVQAVVQAVFQTVL